MSLAKKAISGAFYMSGVSYIGFAVNFGVQLVLVRLLVPDDFGLFALGISIAEMLFIFFSFSFSMAVIQIRDAEDLFDTAFCLSIISGLIILIVGGIVSLGVSSYYPLPTVMTLFIICAVQPLQGCASIYSAFMERELNFKRIAFVRGLSTNTSGMVAVFLAYAGFGVLSLIGREIVTVVLMFFGIRAVSGYRFGGRFNKDTARKLFDFGYKRLLVRGFEILLFRSPLFLIGAFAGTNVLGLFSQVYYLANLPNAILAPASQTVAFAAYSKIQDDKETLGRSFYRGNFFFIRLLLPASLLVYMFPSGILGILYGTKWLEASEMFRHFSIYMLVLPIFINSVIFAQGIGRLTSALKVYGISIVFLFLGLAAAIGSGTRWLIPFSYSLALSVGLSAAFLFFREEGIAVQIKKLFLAPAFFFAFIVVTKSLLPGELYPAKVLIVAAATLIYLSVEYGETARNFRLIKAKLTGDAQ